jgi:hypothetical protein
VKNGTKNSIANICILKRKEKIVRLTLEHGDTEA